MHFCSFVIFVIHFSWYVSKSFMQCNIMAWGYKYSVCCTTFIFWCVKISMYGGKTFMYSGESVISMVNSLYNVLIYYMRLLSNTTFTISWHDVIISLYGVIILNVNSCVNGEVVKWFHRSWRRGQVLFWKRCRVHCVINFLSIKWSHHAKNWPLHIMTQQRHMINCYTCIIYKRSTVAYIA